MSLLQIVRRLQPAKFSVMAIRRVSSMYEPDYLEKLRPKYPLYNTLNFTIKGYDYPILESYQRFVHNVADSMDLDVLDSWAQPPQKFNVQKFKPASAVIESDYKLTVYERNLQIGNLQAPLYPVLVRLLQGALPEGVTLTISEHSDQVDEGRYVPDRDLLDLKQKLEEMGGSREKK
ncbi:39S ribosomal protein L48, mitochondrial [Uranotaenia lowii]|uniref:39S ribosomal protein L48, mitochondrial n=1 Tax=Uranotaenia lowii TaxID=190385 RepID=UPI0024789FD7|nr:39S ribosomal protein L48, mitochondrial [Uranotaenia lowii]